VIPQPIGTFQNLTDRLQAGLNFLTDDLEANERGVLSERQQHTLLAMFSQAPKDAGRGCRFLIMALPLLFAAFLIILFIALEGDVARALIGSVAGFLKQPNPVILVFVVPILILVLSAINSSRIEKEWRSGMRDLGASPDKAVPLIQEGVAHHRWIPGSRMQGRQQYISINRKWLRVNVIKGGEYEAFQDGVSYRVYYLNMGPLPYLLSAKVVSNP
jgi:hypothetical protein